MTCGLVVQQDRRWGRWLAGVRARTARVARQARVYRAWVREHGAEPVSVEARRRLGLD